MRHKLRRSHRRRRHRGRGLRGGVRGSGTQRRRRGARPDRRRRHRGGHGPHRGDGRFARADRAHQLLAQLVDRTRAAASRRCRIPRCGTLWVAADDEEMAEVDASAASTKASACAPKCWMPRARRSRTESPRRTGRRPARARRCRGLSACAARYLLDCARTRGAEVRVGVAARELCAAAASSSAMARRSPPASRSTPPAPGRPS